MFETMTDRITGTVLMGLDVAVEFATLGEFRLVEADGCSVADLFPAAPLVRRPAHLAAITPDRRLLPPASTAIARAAAESAARVAARRKSARPLLTPGAKSVIPNAPRRRSAGPLRSAGIGRSGAPTRPAKLRTRGGAVEAGAQLCLFSR
jgi:hypothetical protein